MGEHGVQQETDAQEMRAFMQQVLDDVRALERMLDGDMIETEPIRIGAEQELFLVDRQSMRPSFAGMEVLEALNEPHFTTELGRFNLEANLDPQVLGPGALRAMERQLRELLDLARQAAQTQGADVVLIGILPTLEKDDLTTENMAPIPRYHALSDAMRRMRGRDFQFYIKGRDELTVTHDSVMLEACNTSFQIHLQVRPTDFARYYNIAQLIAAPTLALSCFSPLLFGRRLWRETRIAVFQQATDTRFKGSHHRKQRPRVRFGERWVDESVLELFRQDIADFRLLLTVELGESSLARLDRGEIPDLKALRLHNGTTYRWNRPCYGVGGGKPHLRIENRILPAGPSVIDEMAGTAFWYGLMHSLSTDLGDIRQKMPFDAAKENFLASARLGLKAQFRWIDGRHYPAHELLREELIPRARAGLVELGLEREEIERYIPIVEARAAGRQNGSQWLLDSLEGMADRGTPAERHSMLTRAALRNQKADKPAHTWPLATLDDDERRRHLYARVGNLMSTDLFTVTPDEVVDLVAALMDWKFIHHIPVEDGEHRLVGLITHRRLLRHLAQNQGAERRPVAVSEVMETDIITVTPSTPSVDAIQLMKEHRIACLPVVDGERLVGILTERDFLRVADKLLVDFLSEAASEG